MRNDGPDAGRTVCGGRAASGERHATFVDGHLFELAAGGELAVADEHEARLLVARGWVRA